MSEILTLSYCLVFLIGSYWGAMWEKSSRKFLIVKLFDASETGNRVNLSMFLVRGEKNVSNDVQKHVKFVAWIEYVKIGIQKKSCKSVYINFEGVVIKFTWIRGQTNGQYVGNCLSAQWSRRSFAYLINPLSINRCNKASKCLEIIRELNKN